LAPGFALRRWRVPLNWRPLDGGGPGFDDAESALGDEPIRQQLKVVDRRVAADSRCHASRRNQSPANTRGM
jgi:hypothetical protein